MLLHATRSVDRMLSGAAQLAEGDGERDESSNEAGGDWPGSEGWHGGYGEMSGGAEIVLSFHVACASPPFLCTGVAPRDKQKMDAKTRGS